MIDVQKMIVEFRRTWPHAEWGPAHIILSDYNLEDHWFEGVVTNLESTIQRYGFGEGHGTEHTIEELVATLEFVKRLREIPEDTRCFYGDDRD